MNHLRQQVRRPCCSGNQARPYECYALCVLLRTADPPTPTVVKTGKGAGGNIALSIRKANKYSWIREKPFHPSQVPDWWSGQEKAGMCVIEVKMAAGGGAAPEKRISLTWKKKGLVGGPDSPQHMEVWVEKSTCSGHMGKLL